MGNIKIMNRSLSDRIAAGEVIERPGSVVKELVENAIDAKAANIYISIEDAGKKLIRVRDDGTGMDEEDAVLAFETHGTSKLKRDEDLFCISTLGFRGEALPSIASVSETRLKTRTAAAPNGVSVVVDGSGNLTKSVTGCAVGTTVEVSNLFYNVPARKKFLKSNGTEEHHIEETILSLALANPNIGFNLENNGRQVLFCAPGVKLADRCRELFGSSWLSQMLQVEYQDENIKITGLIAAPGFTRPSRREQRIFINGRPVESQAVYRGIKDGYAAIHFESGRYPPVILYLELDHKQVDVNVHPAKREVRFQSERAVTEAVKTAINNTLAWNNRQSGPAENQPKADQNSVLESFSMQSILDAAMVKYHRSTETENLPLDFDSRDDTPINWQARAEKIKEMIEQEDVDIVNIRNEREVISLESPGAGVSVIPPEATPEADEMPVAGANWPDRVLGIFRNSYLLCDSPNGLLLVDQHAAHERILFEKLLEQAQNGTQYAQVLLLSQAIELTSSQVSVLLHYQEEFRSLGFDFEQIGRNGVLLNSIPAFLPDCCPEPAKLLEGIIEELIADSGKKITVDLEHAARIACHHAIKANDKLTISEAEELLIKLKKCQQGTLCPHGRPTMITFTVKEIEKMFKRR